MDAVPVFFVAPPPMEGGGGRAVKHRENNFPRVKNGPGANQTEEHKTFGRVPSMRPTLPPTPAYGIAGSASLRFTQQQTCRRFSLALGDALADRPDITKERDTLRRTVAPSDTSQLTSSWVISDLRATICSTSVTSSSLASAVQNS